MRDCVLIAGGGTGGHLFPGLAVARAMAELRPGLRLAVVSAGKALESEVLRRAGLPLEPLKASGFRGTGLVGRLRSLAQVPPAVWRAMGVIRRHEPGLVLAVGGYAALPLGLAARLMGVPLAVQEQNAVPGLTNRILGRFAQVIFTSFPGAEAHLPAAKCELLGNPVRTELLDQAAQTAAVRPDGAEDFRVLVLGGSQGARSLNKGVTEALTRLAPLAPRLRIVHQTGAADEQWVRQAYADAGFQAKVEAFFQDMGALYGGAHAVICRAGAGTLTEVLATGRACLAVPYPFAAGDHQMHNALSLEAAGAARLIADADFDADAAAGFIEDMLAHPDRRLQMEQRAVELARPLAARAIAARCLRILGDSSDV